MTSSTRHAFRFVAAGSVLTVALAGLAACSSAASGAAGSASGSTAAPSSAASSASGATATTGGGNSAPANSASSSASSPGGASGAAAPAAAGGDVTVAELFPMTGKIAFVGDALQHGAAVGIEEVNAAGGVMGHKVVAKLQDTAGDTVDAVPAWHALMLDHPAYELGPTVFTVASVINLYGPSHLPDFMVAGATTYDQMNYPYVFRVTPGDSTMADAMAAYAIAKGYKHAAILFDNGENSQTIVAPLVAAYKSHGGQIAYNASVVPLQASYQSIIARMMATHPDAIFFQTDPQTAGTIFHEMEQDGDLNLPIIATDNGASITLAKAMGMSYATKWMTGMAGATPSGPAYTAYVNGYDKVYHTKNPLDLSENTYDAVVIASLAMTDAKSTDPTKWLGKIMDVSNPPGQKCYNYAACLKLLNAGKKINYEGASGSEDFNQYHNVFGAWNVVRFDASESLQNVYTVSADTVAEFAAKK